jgi:hypothetical protein
LDWQIDSGIELSYGFELQVCFLPHIVVSPMTHERQIPSLQLTVDFADLESSTLTGL